MDEIENGGTASWRLSPAVRCLRTCSPLYRNPKPHLPTASASRPPIRVAGVNYFTTLNQHQMSRGLCSLNRTREYVTKHPRFRRHFSVLNGSQIRTWDLNL